jgi:hypothetical protein
MMFNRWLMICFGCSNTYSWCMENICYGLMIISKKETYSNAWTFWCFCLVLEVNIGYFDAEWEFRLIKTIYINVDNRL